MTPGHLRELVAGVEAWGDRFPPACACGCGDPVRMQRTGPNRYLNRQHAVWGRHRGMTPERFGPVIDVELFRTAVRRIQNTKGWTNNETALRGGWSPGRLRGVMYGKRRQAILETTARAFLRRLAGMPGELTPWERRNIEAMRKSGRRASVEIEQRYMRKGA